jgi:hypothetical protein
MALPTLHPFVIVNVSGSRFRVIYADRSHTKVGGVEQYIMPLRSKAYWRPINLTSKAAAAAVLAAARRLRAAKENPQ